MSERRTDNLRAPPAAPVTPPTLADGQWHDVVTINDGKTERVFIDGKPVTPPTCGTAWCGQMFDEHLHSLGPGDKYGHPPGFGLDGILTSEGRCYCSDACRPCGGTGTTREGR